MSILATTNIDFNGVSSAINLRNPVAAQDAVTKSYVDAMVEGIKWKQSVRASSISNINIAAPGASIDGVTLVLNNRVLLRMQTQPTENGIYIWNGAATPMTRSLDANTGDELTNARVTVEEGTSIDSEWHQSSVNVVIGTTAIVWNSTGSSAPAASTVVAGIARYATQAEVNAGVIADATVTPITLANSVWTPKRLNATIGDSSATTFAITHNFNTRDVLVKVREAGGFQRDVLVEVRSTSMNSVSLFFDAAPAANSYIVTLLA